MLSAQLSVIEYLAETPTEKKRIIYFDGNDDSLFGVTQAVISETKDSADIANENAKVTFTGNNDDVSTKIDEVKAFVTGSTGAVNSGLLGQYDLQATINGVTAGIDTAQKAIAESIENTETTYRLTAEYETRPLRNAATWLFSNDENERAAAGFRFMASAIDIARRFGLIREEDGEPETVNTITLGNAVVTNTLTTGGGVDTERTSEITAGVIRTGEITPGVIQANEITPGTIQTNEITPGGGQTNEITPGGSVVRTSTNELIPGTESFSQITQGVIPPIEARLAVSADQESAEEAAEEASGAAQIALGQNPAALPVAGIKLSEDSFVNEDGTVVYTAQFQVEDSDAVMDVITEIDEASGTVHRIKIVTEGDGTQIIDEFFGDTHGNGKHTTLTIDAEGNAYTELESIEELQEFIERTISFSVNANVSDSQSKLNKLKTTLENIKSKTITVSTNTPKDKSSFAATFAGLLGLPKAANGALNFKGGYALINEEGPEIVAANGTASIYANGFPTVAKIPGGATIYTAEETASMLGGKTSIPAYADGAKGSITDFIAAVGGTFADYVAKEKGTLPKDKKKDEEEEKKKTEREEWEERQSSQSQSSEEGEEASFWDTIRAYIDYGLKKIQYQIDSYQDDITAIERARDALIKPIEEELEDLDYSLSMLQYEVTLLERARDDAIKPLDKEIERLEKARDINKEDLDLEEKRKALEDARYQRTIRYFNEATGQWEWMADQKAIKEAEEAYADALAEYEITALKRERDAIEDQYKEQIEALEDQEEVIERKQEDLEHEKTKIEYEYGESIDPLQDALDQLQQVYDDLDKYYQRLVDAVEVPLESLTDALQKMMSAGENYVAQMEGTVRLLDALYALAPTWSAITVGDIGKYSPEQGKYGSYSSVDQSTTIIVDGITIDGTDATTMSRILGKHRLYGRK